MTEGEGEKKTLQALFPAQHLMTVMECLKELGWACENEEGDKRGTGPITCSCGGKVESGGWVGTEHAHCPDCGKGMQDMTGILPAGRSAGGMIDFDTTDVPRDGKIWIAENVWGWK